MLIASSTVQGRLTWPEMLNSLVPLLLGRPMPEYHCGPRRRMAGTEATVSTLLMVVGQPYLQLWSDADRDNIEAGE
jgi:hypothetical protein